ncbi:peptidase M3 [bacterium]|nr:peptidase M3 [bacterium]
MSLLSELTKDYLKVHVAKEDAFWAAKMGLSSAIPGDAEKREIALKNFISDASWLPKLRAELERGDLEHADRTALEGWVKFFEANAIESEDAKQVQRKIIEMEGVLNRNRRTMELGYFDPDSGDFIPKSVQILHLMLLSEADERKRKAAWEGLRSIETFMLENDFIEIVKERNRFARLQGYPDFYAWKVQVSEGFSKERLFELLDELEENSRDACKAAIDKVADEHGDSAVKPWSFKYTTSGDLTSEKDPYLRFDSAVAQWGRTFTALGIRYRGATLTLDLLDRKGKYENGFMHGPSPAFVEDGEFRPARINFTANAAAGQVGAGNRALNTLFHEGGHAAHFSNIVMPAPCFAQEFAPTSIAFAETQSMFLDSLCSDPDWLAKYALDANGNPMPKELVHRILEEEHTYMARELRKMMVVPYFERAMYEMSDEELTPENLLKTARATEEKLMFMPSDRPVLSIPHLAESESSAYYHAYVLAQMAVFQTRDFFLKRDGKITDNPKVGEDLAKVYWQPGNSVTFLELIERLTGEPFRAKATIELVNKPTETLFADADNAIDRALEEGPYQGEVELDASIRLIHGDEVVANSEKGGFAAAASAYGKWIRAQAD